MYNSFPRKQKQQANKHTKNRPTTRNENILSLVVLLITLAGQENLQFFCYSDTICMTYDHLAVLLIVLFSPALVQQKLLTLPQYCEFTSGF